MNKHLVFFVGLLLFVLAGCSTLRAMGPNQADSQKAVEQQPVEPPAAGPASESPALTSQSETPASPTGVSEAPAGAAMNSKNSLTSAEVRQVQERLKAAGFDPGPIDGIVGPKTRAAVIKYQTSNGLAKTGSLDEETVETLGLR